MEASAQHGRSRLVQYNIKPRPGAVWTADGVKLEGGIVFNDNDGMVLLHLEDEKEVKAFNTNTMSRFEFHGVNGEASEIYYVLEYLDTKNDTERIGIFQILKEFKTFVVLLKIDALAVKVNDAAGDDDRRIGMKTRSLCFLGTDGELQIYAKYMRRESDGLLLDIETEGKKLIDRSLIKKFTGEHYAALEQYAKSKKIGFRKLEDVMDIMSHYETLVNSTR